MDEMILDGMMLDEMAIGRNGIGRNGNLPWDIPPVFLLKKSAWNFSFFSLEYKKNQVALRARII